MRKSQKLKLAIELFFVNKDLGTFPIRRGEPIIRFKRLPVPEYDRKDRIVGAK
jgi:hypothetical protein